ncbi:hypothetical protein WJX81_005248 [Elliptochloris bilobata]|uniref:NADH dehydrogenase [ubiquinone] 1 alpha subcomplex subunit 6 n=1 Tax=Elliptochloris bilobata TaxID=381761 RepID=A0AAW1QML0_9CHLO
MVCRTLPWVVSKYRLDELTTVKELQRVLEKKFRSNWFVRDPRAIDLLIFKGKEELDMVQQQHKQRHHLINDYVVGPQQERQVEELERKENLSKFMKGFYINDV